MDRARGSDIPHIHNNMIVMCQSLHAIEEVQRVDRKHVETKIRPAPALHAMHPAKQLINEAWYNDIVHVHRSAIHFLPALHLEFESHASVITVD